MLGDQSAEGRRHLYHLDQPEHCNHSNLKGPGRQSLFSARYPRIRSKGNQTRTPRFDLRHVWWTNSLECWRTVER